MTVAVDVPGSDRSVEPYFRLLLVGIEGGEVERRLQEIRREGWFERVRVVSPDDLDSHVTSDVSELGTTDPHGCLVVMWDLDAVRDGQPRGETVLSELVTERFELASRWSTQRVTFGFAETTPRLSFLDLVELVDRNVAYLGSFDDCVDTLNRWCGPPDEPGLLGRPFKKLPSKWLRNLHHDYLNGGVLSMYTGPHVKGLGLLAEQQVVDYWQDALRNVLVHVRESRPCRAMRSFRLEDEPEVVRKLANTPFRLIVPHWLREDLREREQVDGEDFLTYRSRGEAIASATALTGEGVFHVLLWDGNDPPEVVRPEVGAAPVPVVLVGEEAPQASWSDWQRLLRRNVLGGYSRAELVGRNARGTSILGLKPARWRPFCFRSSPDAFADMCKVMSRSLESLRPAIGEGRSRKLAWSLAEIEAARELYFGSSELGESGGDA